MTVRRVSIIECGLCGVDDVYGSRAAAVAVGWRRDRWRDGTVVDLCPTCSVEVAIGKEPK